MLKSFNVDCTVQSLKEYICNTEYQRDNKPDKIICELKVESIIVIIISPLGVWKISRPRNNGGAIEQNF